MPLMIPGHRALDDDLILMTNVHLHAMLGPKMGSCLV
jgi:hypothetical protein